MSKGLKALQDIRLRIFIESEVQSKKVVKDLKVIEKELKALDTLLDLIGDIEITQYNKKPPRYEIKICGKCFYVGKEKYDLLTEVFTCEK